MKWYEDYCLAWQIHSGLSNFPILYVIYSWTIQLILNTFWLSFCTVSWSFICHSHTWGLIPTTNGHTSSHSIFPPHCMLGKVATGIDKDCSPKIIHKASFFKSLLRGREGLDLLYSRLWVIKWVSEWLNELVCECVISLPLPLLILNAWGGGICIVLLNPVSECISEWVSDWVIEL